jgi:3-isopropylmalate/(R)-2-methylmalate dehydratase small subunit
VGGQRVDVGGVKAFRKLTAPAAVLDRPDVDTDQIVPKQFLKRIERTGYGEFLFYDWRQEPGFELNRPEFEGARILVTGPNFGCGSSREHAPWALQDYGFRAVIAPSFADIFYGDCCQNGLLPVVLGEAEVGELVRRAEASADGYELTVDLVERRVSDAAGFDAAFQMDPYRRDMLLRGLDEIGKTLELEAGIAEFERRRSALRTQGTS